MLEIVSRLFARVTALAQRAYEAGWISAAAVRDLHHIEHGSPADLFADRAERPLVVALFGGTGVGKSSLLNRLAGAQIARTGVERPTSREVTVFVHESVKLAELPAELPLRHVQISRHANPEQRDVLWIDCPDIDSTVTENRELALAWLAHVDLVVYVVSPERYRDDTGWRVLRQRGQRHGWLFIMNRSDEGRAEQSEDFSRALRAAGFAEPLILRTSCKPGAPADDFEKLADLVRRLIREHGIRELERRGLRARLAELKAASEAAFHTLGSDAEWQAMAVLWDRRWSEAREALVSAAGLAMRGLSERILRDVSPAGGRWSRLLAQHGRFAAGNTVSSDEPPLTAGQLRASIWDGWARGRFLATLEALEVDVAQRGLSSVPLRRRIDEVVGLADDVVGEPLARAAAKVLSESPQDWRARLQSAAGMLCYLLPLAAVCWSGYIVFARFYQATTTTQPGAFLGMDFAVHSVLLVLLAWVAPLGAYFALRPNHRERIARELNRTYCTALDRLAYAVRGVILETAESAAKLRSELAQVMAEIDRWIESPGRPEGIVKSLIVSPAGAEESGSQHGARSRA